MCKASFLFLLLFVLNSTRSAAQFNLKPDSDTAAKDFRMRVLPQNFYTQHLSFFCRQELRLQKLTSLPVYFRAGLKDYIDYLEKKPNAAWLPKR